MTTETTTTTTPKEEAVTLLNDYSATVAALNAVTSELRAQIAELTATLNTAEAPHLENLARMEARLKQLALEHGPAIFGEKSRSLFANGYMLQLRATSAVQCANEKEAINELVHVATYSKDADARTAALACLRTTHELDLEVIGKMIVKNADWFAHYGIVLAVYDSPSVKERPAPKIPVPKATRPKKPRAPKAVAEPLTREAA